MKKNTLFIIAIVLIVVVAFAFYKKTVVSDETEKLILYGNVDIRDVELSFRVAGRIAAVYFEEGDQIKQGDVLALMEQDTFIEDLAIAKGELAEAHALVIQTENNYQRIADLFKTGAVSQSEYDKALSERNQARAQVQAATAQVARRDTALKDTQIYSPSPGIILTRVREPGTVVQAGDPVYTLALNDPIWVRAYVAEPDLGRVYPGQSAVVTTDGGGRYKGQVGFISPQAEFTPKTVETTELRTDLVYRLRVIVNNPDHGLRQGMPVTVQLEKTPAAKHVREGDAS